MPERVDADHAKAIGERVDHAALLPARSVEQQAVLQHDQRPRSFDSVMDALAPVIGEWH
ncbi:hypothetical protein HAP48_0029000 [Bradyrhizobium septentrionale]|uniref:hypothetical protein n=1 Tax=Bradyrhizobium septentrionale TaxID=1404411 RepID=UPI001F42DF01|nr:hypothetical protein [Bradyrhizobium septentrionale]UGY20871.1 hypothetical protein HAP48_0029000 [Bradyrhizobium septentrionale]